MTTIEPIPQTESYRLRNKDGEMMDISINEATGLFMATGDYGPFSHYWTAPGPHGLRHFLGGIQFDYAMGKLAANHGEVFDFDKSVAATKKLLADDGRLYADLEDAFAGLERCNTAEEFCQQISVDDLIWGAFRGDYQDIRCEKSKCPHSVAFWNDFFIPFVASYMPAHTCKPVTE